MSINRWSESRRNAWKNKRTKPTGVEINAELLQIRDEHELRHVDIAKLCEANESAVLNWFKRDSTKISPAHLALLKIRVAALSLTDEQRSTLPRELTKLLFVGIKK